MPILFIGAPLAYFHKANSFQDRYYFSRLDNRVLAHLLGGFISGGLARFDIGGADCELYAIYMLPQYQGNGFGSQLVAKLESYCVDMGWRCMGVLVLADNPNLPFYKRLGFDIVEKTVIELGRHRYPGFKMVRTMTV